MITRTIVLFSALAMLTACSKNEAKDENIFGAGPTYTRDAEGNIVREFDIDGDDHVDVKKYFKEYPDPEDPSVMRQRLFKKEVDVNSDGKINVRRTYNEEGELKLEELDDDLDGTFDVINHVDGGHLVQKDILEPETGAVVAVRYYWEGELQRVEKDTNNDTETDYWEFYEQGVLDRIGRDLNGDGRADTWQRR